jgi:DNA-binding transcriptional LysR family regulator
MDQLHAMRVFVAVVDAHSLSAAASALGTSLPTVSRVLSSLERGLGVRLISRSTHDLTETDAGRLYYARCRQILGEVRDAEAAVQSHAKAPAGELRVTAPVTFGRHHVAPAVADFIERYPGVSVYLLLSDRMESLAVERLDVAIRVAALREQNLIARRLGYIQRSVVGSNEYFARHSVPTHPRQLAKHQCLQFTHYCTADAWRFIDRGRKVTVRTSGRLRTNNQEALVDAVLGGSGLAILPTWLLQQALTSGRLRRVLENFEAPRTPVYAVFPSRGPPPHKARVFVEYLDQRYRERGVLVTAPTVLEPNGLPAGT